MRPSYLWQVLSVGSFERNWVFSRLFSLFFFKYFFSFSSLHLSIPLGTKDLHRSIEAITELYIYRVVLGGLRWICLVDKKKETQIQKYYALNELNGMRLCEENEVSYAKFFQSSFYDISVLDKRLKCSKTDKKCLM